MAHPQQVRHTRILHLLPVRPIEAVVLHVEEVDGISMARVEDEAGPCMPTTEIGITMRVIACLTDPIDREAVQGTLYDANEIRVTNAIETLTGENATTADLYRESTIPTSDLRVQNQDRERLTRTAGAPRLIQGIFLVRLRAQSRIRPITRLLNGMDRLRIRTPDVLQLHRRHWATRIPDANLDEMICSLQAAPKLPGNDMRRAHRHPQLRCPHLVPMFGEILFSMRSLRPHHKSQNLFKLHLRRRCHLLQSRLQPLP